MTRKDGRTSTVTVSYDDYVSGALPPICIVSGNPTRDVFVYRLDVTAQRPRSARPGRFSAAMDAALTTADVRKPRRILVGRIPLDREVERSLSLRRRMWSTAVAVAVLGLVVATWTGAAWSPVAAVACGFLAVIATVQRSEMRRALPHPTIIHGDAYVSLDGVHPAFAAAVDGRRTRQGRP